jgi:glucose-6-phosphate 1-epimerase
LLSYHGTTYEYEIDGMDIEKLNIKYGIAGQLKFVMGDGGFPFILIRNRSATALISLYAGQVLSFLPTGEGEDLLFLSQKAYYDAGKAIRGGVPICWPWFGPDPKGLGRPSHGFVRNGLWAVSGTQAASEFETKIKLRFLETEQSESFWQQPFSLDLEIFVGNTLTLELTTRNTGDKIFSITQAFHAYLHVGNINQMQILGLDGIKYTDNLDSHAQKLQIGAVTVTGEVERIYTNVRNELIIDDSVLNRQIRIASSSNKTAVVWNPWTTKSEKLLDLENDGYQRFICVETGNVVSDVIEVPPANEYSLLTNFRISRD